MLNVKDETSMLITLYVNRCLTVGIDGIRQGGHPRNTWWNCIKQHMKSFGMSTEDVGLSPEDGW